MRRNLRFWSQYTWENVEAELAIVAAFILFLLLNSNALLAGRSWLDVLELLPFYLIVSAAICIIMGAFGTQMLYVPLLVSLGEPRRNVYWGFQYHRFLLIAVTVIASGLIWALVPGDISDAGLTCLPVIVTGLVTVSAAAGLLGSVYIKWKAAGVVFLVLFFGCCGGVAGWMASTGKFDISEMSVNILEITSLVLPWQLVLAAIVLLAADLSVQWLVLRRREVKL